MPRLASQYSVQSAVARGVKDAQVSGTSISAGTPGGVISAVLPSFAVVRLRLNTSTPGRGGRGRTGLSGVMENQTDDTAPNSINSTNQGTFQTAANAFLAELNGGTPVGNVAVVSRISRKVVRTTPLVSPVVSITVESKLGSRVSRLR
jgi:hypothetical protein